MRPAIWRLSPWRRAQTNLSLDAGLYRAAELGDRVWFDANKNGVQDAGEAGVAGVKVTLLDASGNAVGSPLVTDANGNYLFTNLKPGAYSVQFDKTTLPAGYAFTGQDQGGDDQRDSDANAIDGQHGASAARLGRQQPQSGCRHRGLASHPGRPRLA